MTNSTSNHILANYFIRIVKQIRNIDPVDPAIRTSGNMQLKPKQSEVADRDL